MLNSIRNMALATLAAMILVGGLGIENAQAHGRSDRSCARLDNHTGLCVIPRHRFGGGHVQSRSFYQPRFGGGHGHGGNGDAYRALQGLAGLGMIAEGVIILDEALQHQRRRRHQH